MAHCLFLLFNAEVMQAPAMHFIASSCSAMGGPSKVSNLRQVELALACHPKIERCSHSEVNSCLSSCVGLLARPKARRTTGPGILSHMGPPGPGILTYMGPPGPGILTYMGPPGPGILTFMGPPRPGSSFIWVHPGPGPPWATLGPGSSLMWVLLGPWIPDFFLISWSQKN